MKQCIICENEYEGYGNNTEPITEGLCCDSCNTKYVIPRRILMIELDEAKERYHKSQERLTKIVEKIKKMKV